MADGITSLASLNFGTSTGGAASAGETTTTLGLDRQDSRTPPGLSYVWAAQLNAIKNLLLTMTAYFKGGTRLQILPQSANPFGSIETGFYADNSTTPNPRFSALGTLSYLVTAPSASQKCTTYTATFDSAEDSVAVTFAGVSAANPVINHGVIVTDGGPGPLIWFTSVSSAGATVNTSARFSGSVTLTVWG